MPRRAFIASIIKVSGNVNADMGVGTRIPLKKIYTWNQEVRVFVSARCIRRCIRERLYEKGFQIDPLQLVGPRGAQQLGDVGNPVEYIDDDLFGYLLPVREGASLKRKSPITISHLISLRHTEVKPEFAARFPRDFLPVFKEEYPVPFEVEVAEWLGRLDVIVTERVGCFEKGELGEELKEKHKDKLQMRGSKHCLNDDERRGRLRAFLEVLLWEGWQFPRAAQSPSTPEFYYSVIALTERFVPIFGYVDIDDEGRLSQAELENLRNLYAPSIDKLFVIDYRTAKYQKYEKTGDKTLERKEEERLNAESIESIIKEVCGYIIPGQ
ncbi:MAG: type I-B CRISPR-associated protein Cas7/Cst2/DevR [Thermofilaceae archaeon]